MRSLSWFRPWVPRLRSTGMIRYGADTNVPEPIPTSCPRKIRAHLKRDLGLEISEVEKLVKRWPA